MRGIKVAIVESLYGEGQQIAHICWEWRLRDGVVGVGVSVEFSIVNFNRGIIAEFVRPHYLDVRLDCSYRDAP